MKATTRRPRRVTPTQLERLAEVHHKQVEFDNAAGMAYLKLDKPTREYYASLDDEPVRQR